MTTNCPHLVFVALLAAGAAACGDTPESDAPVLRVASHNEHGTLFSTDLHDGPRLMEVLEFQRGAAILIHDQAGAPCRLEVTEADEIVEHSACEHSELALASDYVDGDLEIVDEQFRFSKPLFGGFGGFGGGLGGFGGKAPPQTGGCEYDCQQEEINCVEQTLEFDKCELAKHACVASCGIAG